MRSQKNYWIGASLAILFLQACLTYSVAWSEQLPSPPGLSVFPSQLGQWQGGPVVEFDPAIMDKLAPDDFYSRRYRKAAPDGDVQPASTQAEVELFVTYYQTQNRVKKAHSPKICLPSTGWQVENSREVKLDSGDAVNYYLVRRGGQQSLVFYWYQSPGKVIANEQRLNLQRVADRLTKKRSDMAFIRVSVPVSGQGLDRAEQTARDFSTRVIAALQPQFVVN